MFKKWMIKLFFCALYIQAIFCNTLPTFAQNGIQVPSSLRSLDVHLQGQKISSHSFQTLKGSNKTIQDFKGHLVLLTIWSPHCAPCLSEMASLASLSKKFSPQKLELINVATHTLTANEAEKILIQNKGQGLTIYQDPNHGFINELGVSGTPTSILIDEEGKEVWRLPGGVEWHTNDVIQFFQTILGAQ